MNTEEKIQMRRDIYDVMKDDQLEFWTSLRLHKIRSRKMLSVVVRFISFLLFMAIVVETARIIKNLI